MTRPPKLEQRPSQGAAGMGLFARERIEADQWIGEFWGDLWESPTQMSVQFGPYEHIDPSHDCILRYLNHSCAPNTYFRDRMLHARRVIDMGEEITIDYNCTEYDLSAPFACRCGAEGCIERVEGFRYLTTEQRVQRSRFAADWMSTSNRRL